MSEVKFYQIGLAERTLARQNSSSFVVALEFCRSDNKAIMRIAELGCFVISHQEDNASWNAWTLERRHDGAIVVRVPSLRPDASGRRLPDAVFAFRNGDPQYGKWAARLAERSPAS